MMKSWIELLGLAVTIFVSTNVDGLFVLLSFFSHRNYKKYEVVMGQYFGVILLFGVSVLASLAARIFPANDIGWLGLAPVAIGCKKIFDLFRPSGAALETPQAPKSSGTIGRILAVAVVTIANGGDNIGVYTPQFSVHSGGEIAVMGLVFAVMAGIWCLVAQLILIHPRFKVPIDTHGHRIVPFVLVALGFLTLYDGGIIRF